MADSRTTENCLRWITDEEHIHRTAEYGDNLRSVGDALSEQVSRDQLVQDYSKEVKAVSRDKEDDVNVRYECLKTVSSKRLSCLEDINQIAGLEELLGALSVSFADKASQLVAAECQREVHVPEKDGAGVKAAAQNCILAVRSNWAWLSKLVKCTDIHLQHSSDYHEFFHEVHEYEHWMPIELRDCKDKVKFTEETEGDRAEANRMLLDLKDLLIMFIHWQGKLEKLYNRSKNVIPVHLRTQKLDYFRPVSSLCDYKTKEIHMREGEELLLIDNSKAQSWTVRNMNAVESQVPAVVCLLPGPDPDAMQAAMRLRFQLLVEWTQNVKRIGKALIFFMILVLRDWSDDEIKMLKAIPSRQKDDIRRCLDYVESVLAPYWAEYEGYQEYKRRADDLREILAQDGDPADRDSEKTAELLQKLFVVEDLLKNYNTYWKHWETFKMLVETCKHDDYMLICEKWQELQFIGLDELRRMWHDRLKFSDEDNIDFASWLKRQKELWYSLQGRGMTSDRGTLKRMVTVEEESIVPQKGHVLGEGKEDQSRNRQATTMQAMLGLSAKNGSTNQNNYDAMHIEKEEVVETEESSVSAATYGSGPGIEEDIMCAETAQESSATAAMYGAGINEDIITAETVQESESMQSVATLGSEVTETKSSANAALYGSETKEETMYTETVQESESMQTQSEELTQTEETSTNYQTTTSESVTSVEQEERKTFVITGVIDTRTDEEVSMQKAVMLGIINSSQGIYVNLKNGESYPIPVAMNAGLIKVEFTSTKKSEEKRRDVGLITIKTQRESRPYSVKAVVDAVTDEHLTVDKAIQKGILDQRKGIYKNARDKIDMSLADALDSGLLIVEFDKNAEVTEPEIVTKTYAIHGVVDQKKKAKVTFTEAVKQNLLDRETGAYRNNITNQMMYVGDAIMKGFIKATLVKDPNSLDIDPENRMVVQKLQSVRKQLLNPLTATAALKRAADHYEQNGK